MRLAFVCVGWILLWIVAVVGWLFVAMARSMPPDTEGGGLGAVSIGISDAVIWLILGPVPGLLIAWLIARRSRVQP